jgi:hypothetical protein
MLGGVKFAVGMGPMSLKVGDDGGGDPAVKALIDDLLRRQRQKDMPNNPTPSAGASPAMPGSPGLSSSGPGSEVYQLFRPPAMPWQR